METIEPSTTLQVGRFYHFEAMPPSQLAKLQADLESWSQTNSVRGLILIGNEGLNGTVSAASEAVDALEAVLAANFEKKVLLRRNEIKKNPFRRFKLKIKSEIVTLGRTDLVPFERLNHLSPEEWHEWVQREDVLILDTRNDFEVNMGRFRGATDLRLSHFQEFPEKLKQSNFSKDRPVLIYCTGGIRCEKAILEMQEQGFKTVKQLDGGILTYMETLKDQSLFEGECFVFDHRVAVDRNLQPSRTYSLCPHCGQPADQPILCKQCGRSEKICRICLNEQEERQTCSKNCAHHFRHGHNTKRPHLDELRKRGVVE